MRRAASTTRLREGAKEARAKGVCELSRIHGAEVVVVSTRSLVNRLSRPEEIQEEERRNIRRDARRAGV